MAGSINSAFGPGLRCRSALPPGAKDLNWAARTSPAGIRAAGRPDGSNISIRHGNVALAGRGAARIFRLGDGGSGGQTTGRLPLLRGRPRDHRAPGRPSCPVVRRPWRVPLLRLRHRAACRQGRLAHLAGPLVPAGRAFEAQRELRADLDRLPGLVVPAAQVRVADRGETQSSSVISSGRTSAQSPRPPARKAHAGRSTSPATPAGPALWATDPCNRARGRGHDHPHAVRILARAWLFVIWHCWQDGVAYDPARHRALHTLLKQDQQAAA